MPFEIKAFGVIDLVGSDERSAVNVLRQPKRLALLLYLAFARPRGFRQRDELLGLLWPEYDQDRARAALSKTLHFLRSDLGAEVIQRRGVDELGLDFSLFDSDVDRFEAALAEGRQRDAVELYRGEFLAAFYADTSPTFERWLEAERLRLRERAADAASAIAESERKAGNLTEALSWARRAAELVPFDEPVMRRLLLVLDATGDRASAIEIYQEFTKRLAGEFDIDPSPESAALIAAIRARSESHLSYVDPTPAQTETVVMLPSTAGSSEPVTATEGEAEAPSAPRRWRLAGPVAAVAFVGVVGAILGLRHNPGRALEPDRFAIAPFQVFDTSLAGWAVGVEEFVSRSLDQTGGLRMVPPDVARHASTDPVTLGSAAGFGRATGARLVLLGSLLRKGGDSVRIDASLIDAGNSERLGDIEITGTLERVDLLVDSLTVDIVRSLGAAGRVLPLPLSRLSAHSVPAIKTFLAGEMALRRGAWDTAQTIFRDATNLDSTFSLAWLRLGITSLYIDVQGGPGWKYLLRAGRIGSGLSRHDSMLVTAMTQMAEIAEERMPHDSLRPSAARVLALALQMTRDYPTDPEAWFILGEVRAGLLPLLQVSWASASDAMRRATELDSTFVPAYPEALKYALEDGDTVSAVRMAKRFLTLDLPGATRALPLLLVRLFDPGVKPAERERFLDSLSAEALFRAWSRLWLLPDASERVIDVARAATRRQPDPRYWVTAATVSRRDLASVLAYRGHVREALAVAGTENSTWCPWVLPDLALAGAMSPAVADSAIHDWIRIGWSSGNGALYAFWWLAAERDTASLVTLMHAGPGPPASLQGALALARGDTAGAIRLLQGFHPGIAADQYTKVVLARLLVATGHREEALEALEQATTNQWPMLTRVTWRLERAGLEESLGQMAAARDDYAYVAAVWQHADPELARYVAQAREGMQRLAGR